MAGFPSTFPATFSGAASTSAFAGVASGSGTAPQPAVSTPGQPTAEVATGTGAALDATTTGGGVATLTFKYELALTTQPFDPSPSYTDITQYVLRDPAPEISFGRPDQFSAVEPATLRLALNNRDGRFTQFLTTGAYYPNIKIGKRIRVTATYNSVVYRRYDGHVNEWPTAWLANRVLYATADITATDRLKRFGQIGELRSMLEEEILLDCDAVGAGGSAYYPLSEESLASSAGSISPQTQSPLIIDQIGVGGSIEWGDGIGPGTDGLAAPMFVPASSANGQTLRGTLTTPVGGAALTLEAWVRPGIGILSRIIAAVLDGSGNAVSLSINQFGEAEAAGHRSAGETYAIAWATDINDGRTHHVAVTEAISGGTVTARLYVDGAERASTTFSSTALPTCRYIHIGGWKVNSSGYGVFAGTLSHVAAHTATLSAARILAHYQAGATGFAGERTDQRIARIADYMAIPSADRSFDTGDGTVGFQNLSGAQPLDGMRQVEQVEDGVLFINPADGDLTFHKRSRRYNTTTSFTLDATAKHIQHGIIFPGDDFGMINDYSVSRPGGALARAVNQASIDEYGLYRESAEFPAGDDTASYAAASWRVNTYGTPRTRLPSVEISLSRMDKISVSLVASIMAATIGTKIRISNLPTQAPATTVDGFIEGWTEVLDPTDWRIALNLSPADISGGLAPVGLVWQLGVAGFSELGVTTRTGQ